MPATVLGDEVDTGVSAPSSGPLIPQPHPAKLTRVHPLVRQEPPADALKLPTPPNWVGVTPAQQISERHNDRETKRSRTCASIGSSRRPGYEHTDEGGSLVLAAPRQIPVESRSTYSERRADCGGGLPVALHPTSEGRLVGVELGGPTELPAGLPGVLPV